jgi:hypothetical protein
MNEEKEKTKLWFENQKIWNIIFTDDDLKVLLAILEEEKKHLFSDVNKEIVDKVIHRIYFQMHGQNEVK